MILFYHAFCFFRRLCFLREAIWYAGTLHCVSGEDVVLPSYRQIQAFPTFRLQSTSRAPTSPPFPVQQHPHALLHQQGMSIQPDAHDSIESQLPLAQRWCAAAAPTRTPCRFAFHARNASGWLPLQWHDSLLLIWCRAWPS